MLSKFLLASVFTLSSFFSTLAVANNNPDVKEDSCLFCQYEVWHIIWSSKSQPSYKGLWAKVNDKGGYYGLLTNSDESNITIVKNPDGTFKGAGYGIVSKSICNFSGTINNNQISNGAYTCDTGDSGTLAGVISTCK